MEAVIAVVLIVVVLIVLALIAMAWSALAIGAANAWFLNGNFVDGWHAAWGKPWILLGWMVLFLSSWTISAKNS